MKLIIYNKITSYYSATKAWEREWERTVLDLTVIHSLEWPQSFWGIGLLVGQWDQNYSFTVSHFAISKIILSRWLAIELGADKV